MNIAYSEMTVEVNYKKSTKQVPGHGSQFYARRCKL